MEEDIPIAQLSNRHAAPQTPMRSKNSENMEETSESAQQVSPSNEESDFGQREALLYSVEDMTAYLNLRDRSEFLSCVFFISQSPKLNLRFIHSQTLRTKLRSNSLKKRLQ